MSEIKEYHFDDLPEENLDSTLCFSGHEDLGEVLYFCADDLYGYYSFEEMAKLICLLQIRFKELKDEYEKNH